MDRVRWLALVSVLSAVPLAGAAQPPRVHFDMPDAVGCRDLTPLETVAASGTLLRGSSVFFKIKSTPRNLLEGTREYALVLSVPAAWRADYIRVRCEAEGIRRGMVSTFDEQTQCGQREFLASLY